MVLRGSAVHVWLLSVADLLSSVKPQSIFCGLQVEPGPDLPSMAEATSKSSRNGRAEAQPSEKELRLRAQRDDFEDWKHRIYGPGTGQITARHARGDPRDAGRNQRRDQLFARPRRSVAENCD